jgi:hypothetical protein
LEEVIRYFESPKEERIAMICPVRNITEDQKKDIDNFINKQREEKKSIYCPIYHTDQNDSRGLTICRTNGTAIMNAGKIKFYFEPTSNGSWFDYGMAYFADSKFECINPEYFNSIKKNLTKKEIPKKKHWWSKEIREAEFTEDEKLERFIAYHSGVIPFMQKSEFESIREFEAKEHQGLYWKDLQNYRGIEYEKETLSNQLVNDGKGEYHVIEDIPADRMSHFNLGMKFMDNLKNGTPIVLGEYLFYSIKATTNKSFQNVLLDLEKIYDGKNVRWYIDSQKGYRTDFPL